MSIKLTVKCTNHLTIKNDTGRITHVYVFLYKAHHNTTVYTYEISNASVSKYIPYMFEIGDTYDLIANIDKNNTLTNVEINLHHKNEKTQRPDLLDLLLGIDKCE